MIATEAHTSLIHGWLDRLWDKYNAEEIEECQGPNCSMAADWVRTRLGRFGRDAEIVGYWHEDNPTAKAGEVEGGHDFLLLGGRYIVDFWQKEVWDAAHPLLLDAKHNRDEVLAIYGDPHTWKGVPHWRRPDRLLRYYPQP
jgi:hypothetical protein